jgi:hypothetical protein
MLHNITARFGIKRILWNDFSNRKWNIKLGNIENRTGKALATRICWSTVGQMEQSWHSCLTEREMKIRNDRQEFFMYKID